MNCMDPETTGFVVDSVFDFHIENFRNASAKPISMESHEHYDLHFCVTLYIDGMESTSKGHLEVSLEEKVHIKTLNHVDDNLTLTLSIIDGQGDRRMPMSSDFITDYRRLSRRFNHSKNLICSLTYLERSRILNRAREFLSNGVLTIRCEISYTCRRGYLIPRPEFQFESQIDRETDRNVKKRKKRKRKGSKSLKVDTRNHHGSKKPGSRLNIWFESIPSAIFFKNGAKGDIVRVFDFTFNILTLPPFHEHRKPFGLYGIPSFNTTGHFKEPTLKLNDGTSVLEDIWIIDVDTNRYLISSKSKMWRRLLEASPIIRDLIRDDMENEGERLFELTDIGSSCFKIELFYLKTGELAFSDFSDIVQVHEMAILYGMKELQQKCFEKIMESNCVSRDYRDLCQLTGYYTTECRQRLQNYDLNHARNSSATVRKGKYRSNFECYI